MKQWIAVTLTLLLTPVVFASHGYGQAGMPEGLYYRSWAVVIGIDDYLAASKVDWAVSDAKAAAQLFRDLGFEEIIELYDQEASSEELRTLFERQLLRKVGHQDRLVVFFAGHAGSTTDRFGDQIGYLVPWDASRESVSHGLTMEALKNFGRRIMAKHVLFLLDTSISGWQVSQAPTAAREGRQVPVAKTEQQAVQVVAAARDEEGLVRHGGEGVFMEALSEALRGSADLDKDGWMMASELGRFLTKRIPDATDDRQHAQFAQLSGGGDMVLIEGKPEASPSPSFATEEERKLAAQDAYNQAYAILGKDGATAEALSHIDRALTYLPDYGPAHVLKAYVFLEKLGDPARALDAAKQAAKHAPAFPDAHFMLGMIHKKRGDFQKAEEEFRETVRLAPPFTEAYLFLGDLYAEHLHDEAKAVAAYQEYLRYGGTSEKARKYLNAAEPSESRTDPNGP